MNTADKIFQSVKSLAKLVLQSRPTTAKHEKPDGERLIIMANGPSLATTIAEHRKLLMSASTLAVNFAAMTPEFRGLKPRYYVLADPYFFADNSNDANLVRLRAGLASADWPMTLLVPVRFAAEARKLYPNCALRTFNAVGMEGFAPLSHFLYRMGAGMPRPRNVLIPSIMLGIAMGYKEIIVTGADHSWMQTLSVTDDNEVVSIQPHFYKDGEDEKARVRHDYRNYRLHQIVESFAVAFKSYHDIAAYAASRGVKIINATPGSFIDAFERKKAEDIL